MRIGPACPSNPRKKSLGRATSLPKKDIRSYISPRRRPIFPPGLANGRANTRLNGWVEEVIEQTLTFFRLPRQHHKHLKSSNMLERLNEEIRRGTHVARILPQCRELLRLVRALVVETHENWMAANRYNIDYLREHKKLALRHAA